MDVKKCNYFYVYQNKTFFEECRGGFLWSPQYTRDGKTHPGYECMKEVQKGDLVFHSFESAIVAISRVKTNCYSARIPSPSFSEWEGDGWRIDTEYYRLPRPFIVTEYQKVAMYKIQPPNGPFLSNGRGKQQYLCNVSTPLFNYLVDKILAAQTTTRARDEIRKFLDYTPTIGRDLTAIEDGCKVEATLLEQNKKTILTIDASAVPNHKNWLGKKVGEILTVPGVKLSYRVERIYKENNK